MVQWWDLITPNGTNITGLSNNYDWRAGLPDACKAPKTH